MRQILAACAVVALAVCPIGGGGRAAAAEPIKPVATEVPAGSYALDRAHASLIFRVNHLGLSRYTARFTRFEATLELDPAQPARSRLTAMVDPRSLKTDFP